MQLGGLKLYPNLKKKMSHKTAHSNISCILTKPVAASKIWKIPAEDYIGTSNNVLMGTRSIMGKIYVFLK